MTNYTSFHPRNGIWVLLPVFVLSTFLLSGCYGSRVTTEAEPSNKKIEKKWATGFIYGLATPGANFSAADRCNNGVAIVETKVSFLNLLASNITFGLYTPMTVEVTCAAGSSMSNVMPAPDVNYTVPEDALEAETRETITAAAHKSADIEKPVQVKFTK